MSFETKLLACLSDDIPRSSQQRSGSRKNLSRALGLFPSSRVEPRGSARARQLRHPFLHNLREQPLVLLGRHLPPETRRFMSLPHSRQTSLPKPAIQSPLTTQAAEQRAR